MNPINQILMELQAAAARIMRAPLKEQKAAAVSQEVLDASHLPSEWGKAAR